MSLPFMPMYWGDYWRDTNHLSDAEHVSYLKLISHYWTHGSLPDDDARLARIAGRSTEEWMGMKSMLQAFFKHNWTHSRIDRELVRQKSVSESNSQRARKAATVRWGGMLQASSEHCLTNANQSQNHNQILDSESKKESVPRSSRGSRLPADWFPDLEEQELAAQLGVPVKAELEKFRDYWISQPGQKGVKVDWAATWRNWIRRVAERPSAKKSTNRILDVAKEMLDVERSRNQSSRDYPVFLPFGESGRD